MGTCFTAIRRHVTRRTGLKRLCLALILGGGIAAPLVPRAPASAAIICSSDPVLVVNGAVVNVVSTLGTDPSAVREVDYQVTVPAGSLINGTTLTVGLGIPEKVTYIFSPSQPWGSVHVATSVIAQDGVAPFPVSVQVSSLLAGTDEAHGVSDATTSVDLAHLLML